MGINCMSLAAWLGEDRKCFAAVAGSDLASGLSMVRRCSLNRSFKRRLVSPMYCKLQRLHSIMQMSFFVSQVRFDFMGAFHQWKRRYM